MQEDVGVDHYARHEELFKKRLSLLRESLDLVEQRRRMTRERSSSPALKRVILRLKQSQADALDVKCKNQKLLQAVDDMLMEKQAQLPIKSPANVTTKELCCAIVKEHKLDDTCSDVGQEGAVIIRASDADTEIQHQATSHIKLQDLGFSLKKSDTDASCLPKPITCSCPHEKVLFRTSEEVPAQHIVSELQAIIPHSTPVLEEKVALHSILTVESLKFADIDGIAHKNQPQDTSTETGSVCTFLETSNERTSVACSELPCLNHGLVIEEICTHTEQKNEHLTDKHERLLEQGDDCRKPGLLSCVRLKEHAVVTDVGDTAPSRFLQISDVGNQLHDQDRTLIRRKRAELAISPSREKLLILDNIYSAIHESQYTLWAYESEHVWNPGLVFSIIEAARVGGEEVRKVLNSKGGGSQLLICCEAICELVHAFPSESLVPSKFVEECLLATQSLKVDIHDWIKRSLLTTYQEVDSALFWDSLTRHAVYLVTHELATAKQIASIFTGILLPASRLNDTLKDAYESARVNLHIFIAILLGTKDALATLSSQVNGCDISKGLDCDSAQVTLYKHDNDNSRNERQESALLSIIQMPLLEAEEPAKNELSTTPSKATTAPSCLSCSLLVKCLPWKKSKV